MTGSSLLLLNSTFTGWLTNARLPLASAADSAIISPSSP